MRKTLLKDMPKHAERIEGNYSLLGIIKDRLNDATVVNGLHIQIHGGRIEFAGTVSLNILNDIEEFVNTNYNWKGDKA